MQITQGPGKANSGRVLTQTTSCALPNGAVMGAAALTYPILYKSLDCVYDHLVTDRLYAAHT